MKNRTQKKIGTAEFLQTMPTFFKEQTSFWKCPSGIFLANNSNFDRNPLRGCNYGLEGGAFLILGGATTALGGALLYPWGQQ